MKFIFYSAGLLLKNRTDDKVEIKKANNIESTGESIKPAVKADKTRAANPQKPPKVISLRIPFAKGLLKYLKARIINTNIIARKDSSPRIPLSK